MRGVSDETPPPCPQAHTTGASSLCRIKIAAGSHMKLEVECYSGRKADERPVRFHLEEHTYVVEELLDQWYGPDDIFYKLLADDDLYILKKQSSTPEGAWSLVSFRKLGKGDGADKER